MPPYETLEGCRVISSAWGYSGILIALLIAIGAAGVGMAIAARGEAATPDLGYGRYVYDALRAGVLFSAWCFSWTVAALLEPCLFLVGDHPIYVGLVYWLGLFVSLAFYSGWALKRDQARNLHIQEQLKDACANYRPLYEKEPVAHLNAALQKGE